MIEQYILLVEDMEINREIVKTLLEPMQVKIDSAENGKDAVRMFSESPEKYNLILMDIQMPEMDGYDATRRIRAIEAEIKAQSNNGILSGQQIPIVAMTANVFKEDVARCLEAGMTDHIGKPLDIEQLFNILGKYLKNL